MPVLKRLPEAALTANCLRNTPLWDDIDQYHCEYLTTSDEETISKIVQVAVADTSQIAEQKAGIELLQNMLRNITTEGLQSLSPVVLQLGGLEHIRDLDPETVQTTDVRSLSTKELDKEGIVNPLADYSPWSRTSFGSLPFARLLPRPKLVHWLFTMFLKIVIPANRSFQDWDTLFYAPLNLTIFMRILIHLHEVGYPSHWLSEVLAQILENQVVTTARPPQTSPLKIEESRKDHPMKQLSCAPFIDEMRSLTALFLPLLPFSIMTSVLPRIEEIYEYKIAFTVLCPGGTGLPVFVLVFWNEKLAADAYGSSPAGPPDLRLVLHPDCGMPRSRSKSEELRILRQKGVKLVTTFKWDPVKCVASFWIAEGVMEEMQVRGGWLCAIYRTDIWDDVCPPVLVSKGGLVSKGIKWVEFSAGL